MIKNYIWDLDGTLFDSYPAMAEAFLNVMKRHGVECSYDFVFRELSDSMPKLIKKCRENFGMSGDIKSEFFAERNITEKNMKLFPGMKEVIFSVKNGGKRNYLYTHREESAIFHMKRAGLYEAFSDFVTGDDGFERKPSPQALLYLIKENELIKDECLMIGDREIDILAAKNAGIRSCFFSGGKNITVDSADYNVAEAEQILSL